MEMHVPNKIVPIYSTPEAGERCHVHILNMYLSKLPEYAISKDVFYLRPLSRVSTSPSPWFQSVPIGKKQLTKMVLNMCSAAGIQGPKSNHSLCATGATDLFQGNVPEKLIQERTGHKNVQALRVYQQTTNYQHQAVSKVLATRSSFHNIGIKQPDANQQDVCQQQPVPVFKFDGCTVNINMGQAEQFLPFPMPPPSSHVDEKDMLDFLKDLQ